MSGAGNGTSTDDTLPEYQFGDVDIDGMFASLTNAIAQQAPGPDLTIQNLLAAQESIRMRAVESYGMSYEQLAFPGSESLREFRDLSLDRFRR